MSVCATQLGGAGAAVATGDAGFHLGAAVTWDDRRLFEPHLRELDLAQHVGRNLLSGGNQQKLVVGKWLAASGHIFLLDEPTRGVDVGAREEIYALLNELTDQGASIVVVSSDSEELLALSDRILVFREGAVVGELTGEDRREENVLRLALGGRALGGREP